MYRMTKQISKIIPNCKRSLRLETLENRQLLASIISGNGEEVGTDIEFQGNIYDQILMTGVSITVEADPEQIVRVSYQDENFDILQTEFSGDGQLSITLENFVEAADPININQPGVQYVTGTPSFYIQNSNLSTNFTLSTVGPVTSPIWDTLAIEGVEHDGVANVKSLTINSNPLDLGGSLFGGIRMANSLFSGSNGTIGISAPNVNIQNAVIIGDIEASGTGLPTLKFGDNSQFESLKVAGGDLLQSNNIKIFGGINAGIGAINFIEGTDSQGNILPAKTDNSPGWIDGIPVTSNINNTVDPIDITGLTQIELDTLFQGKTFINDIIIEGDFLTDNTIQANEFQGNLTFRKTEDSEGIFQGAVDITEGINGNLIFQGITSDPENPGINEITVSSDISLGSALLGDLIFGDSNEVDSVNYSGNFTATSTGNIWVYGDFSGKFSTDAVLPNLYFTQGEGALGDLNISGNYSGAAVGILGIGNIAIGGNLTTTDSNGATAFYTSSGGSGNASVANVGTITIDGDVDQSDPHDNFIIINKDGNFGDIEIKGEGSLGNTSSDFLTLGDIETGLNLGGSDVTGSITINEDSSDIELRKIDIKTGTLGDMNIVGPGTTDTDLKISKEIGGDGAVISAINISAFQTIQQDAAITGALVGNVSYTTNTPTATDNTLIDLDNFIDSGSNIGTIVLNAGATDSSIDINTSFIDADSGDGNIDAIYITGETVTLDNDGGTVIHANNIASINVTGATIINGDLIAETFNSITIDGSATFGDGVGFQSTKSLGALEITGATTFNTTSGNPNIQLADSGTLVFGNTDFASKSGASPAILADDGTGALDIIGAIVINGTVLGNAGEVDIQASAIGDFTVTDELSGIETSLITNLNVLAIPNLGTSDVEETVELDGSNLDNYSIGDINISTSNDTGLADTALFANTATNSNSFIALGKIGDITLTAGGSTTVQTHLLYAGDDKLLFYVGDLSGDPTTAATIDFDGDDSTTETYSDLSGGTVSIGNISIQGASINSSSDPQTIQFATGSGSDGDSFSGLNILVGVNGNGNVSNAVDDDGADSDLSDAGELLTRNDTDLAGTIGNINIATKALQLDLTTIDGVHDSGDLTIDGNNKAYGAIAAATDIGLVNGNAGNGLDDTKEGVLVGDVGAAGNTVLQPGELLIYIV